MTQSSATRSTSLAASRSRDASLNRLITSAVSRCAMEGSFRSEVASSFGSLISDFSRTARRGLRVEEGARVEIRIPLGCLAVLEGVAVGAAELERGAVQRAR